ncbi:MAG: hypothetical protein ACXV4A_15595 [Actinomycetes bacterium]
MLTYSLEQATTDAVVVARPQVMGSGALVPSPTVDRRIVSPTDAFTGDVMGGQHTADTKVLVSGKQLWSHPPV